MRMARICAECKTVVKDDCLARCPACSCRLSAEQHPIYRTDSFAPFIVIIGAAVLVMAALMYFRFLPWI